VCGAVEICCGRSAVDSGLAGRILNAVPKSSHPLLRSLGQAIRSRRRERGLSQESLADIARIDRSYMSGVERGLRNVSILSVARIAGALQIPLSELFRPRRTAGGLRQEWSGDVWDLPAVAPPVEPIGAFVNAGPPAQAPGSPDSEWEPRDLSLG
jgi:transcriptional regulator with XRE-family HTH domain